MAREDLSIRKKILILRKYWKGETPSSLSRRYGVARSTIYRWHRQAMAAVRAALSMR